MKELQQQIIEWAEAKGINNPYYQRLRVMGSIGKLTEAIAAEGNYSEIAKRIADASVEIIILYNLENCLLKFSWVVSEQQGMYDYIKRLAYEIASNSPYILETLDDISRYHFSNLKDALTMGWDDIKNQDK